MVTEEKARARLRFVRMVFGEWKAEKSSAEVMSASRAGPGSFVAHMGKVREETTFVAGSQARSYVIGGTCGDHFAGDTGTCEYDEASGACLFGGSTILGA